MKIWNTAFCPGLLILCVLMFGCQESSPPSPADDPGTAREMMSFFEAIDFEANGYSSLEEALEGIYQDEGYTVTLYRELETVVDQTGATSEDYDYVFEKCQEWFEMIDVEANGYSSMEEAIGDIYQDGGETLELYRKLVKRNANSS